MKKRKYSSLGYIVVICFLLLIGFAIGTKYQAITSRTDAAKGADLELQAFLFQKNQECAQLRDGLQNEANKYGKEIGATFEVHEIFYSPKQNSCLYTRAMYDTLESIKEFSIENPHETQALFDAYTAEVLYSLSSCMKETPDCISWKEADETMAAKIQEYK